MLCEIKPTIKNYWLMLQPSQYVVKSEAATLENICTKDEFNA